MIYANLDREAPIRQGDIFRRIPRVDLSLETMSLLTENGEIVEMDWLAAIEESETCEAVGDNQQERIVRAILPISTVDAIAISQDCDAARDEELSFCEIGPVAEMWKQLENTNPKKVPELLARQGTEQIKIFYLPPDTEGLTFSERMVADFSSVLRIPRVEIEGLKHLRVGRLNDEAYQHFREKLSQYFRRYPVDPWYPLNRDEFQIYKKNRDGVEARPWQV